MPFTKESEKFIKSMFNNNLDTDNFFSRIEKIKAGEELTSFEYLETGIHIAEMVRLAVELKQKDIECNINFQQQLILETVKVKSLGYDNV